MLMAMLHDMDLNNPSNVKALLDAGSKLTGRDGGGANAEPERETTNDEARADGAGANAEPEREATNYHARANSDGSDDDEEEGLLTKKSISEATQKSGEQDGQRPADDRALGSPHAA